MKIWLGGWEWRHGPEACAEDFGDLRKVNELSFSVRRRRLTFGACRDQTSCLYGVPHVVWGRWKSQHKKIVYLSPYVEKPFNSKVIKCFVPELRRRKVFRVSGFLCYLYMSYGHYKRFAYRYGYVYFTYSYLAMWHPFVLNSFFLFIEQITLTHNRNLLLSNCRFGHAWDVL